MPYAAERRRRLLKPRPLQGLARAVGEREQPVTIALREPRDRRCDRDGEPYAPGVGGAKPVAAAVGEQARVTAPQLRVDLVVARGAPRELARPVEPIAVNGLLDRVGGVAGLRQRHPEVPVLERPRQAPPAHREQGVAPVERRVGQGVEVGDPPGIEIGRPPEQRLLRLAEQRQPTPHRGDVAPRVELVRQGGHRPRKKRVVGVQRQDVRGARCPDPGHARGRRAAVPLVDHLASRGRQLSEHGERRGIGGPVVHHHELAALLLARGPHGLRHGRAVVEARDHDRGARCGKGCPRQLGLSAR